MGCVPALAIELSDRHGSVAVRNADGLVRSASLGGGRGAAESALATIDRLAREIGMFARELELIAVSVGPGSFTGIRIAIASAQAIAEVGGAALIAVPSALVAVASTLDPATHPVGRRAVIVLAPKSRGDEADAWITRARTEADGWHLDGPGGLESIADLRIDDGEDIVADASLPALADAPWTRDRSSAAPRFDAAVCLELGAALADAGGRIGPLELRPIYAREPEAVTLWRARGR